MRFDNLSETAWRVFTYALMWSVANGTDGLIPVRYSRYLHPDGDQPAAFDELTAAGIWESTSDGFQMIGWDGDLGQSTAAEVEAYRGKARERQRRYRERAQKRKADKITTPPPELPTEPRATRDETRDVTRDVTRLVGKAKAQAQAINATTGEVSDEFDSQQNLRTVGSDDLSWPVASLGSEAS